MAIEKALRWVVLGGIFVIPFIVFLVAESLFFPFITGKNFAFRIIVEVIAGAYLALALLDPAYRPKRTLLLMAFAAFVVIVALADAFGVFPFKSFWSNYERMDGWVTLAHLFLYFVVAASVLNTEKLWRVFWHTSLVVSAFVALYGLLQVAGIASLNPGFSSATRIDATFGNPIYLAVYMLFHIGIAAALWASRYADLGRDRKTYAFLYGGVIALDTLILFLTGTRGTMLGLIGGVLLAALLIAFASSDRARRIALAAIAGIVVLTGVFVIARDTALVQSVPFLQRLATISLEDNTTKARFYNWGMAWEGVKERPILGWGQEHYAIVFDKYYDPRMYAQEQWFDRVHNIIFDWLVAAGFLGLFAYLSLFGAALYILWRTNFNVYERSILTGLLAGYFFHNLFVFDNIMSYILFATVLAYIAWRGSEKTPHVALPTVPHKYAPIVAALAIALVRAAAWYVNARPISANRALLQGLAPQQAGLTGNLESLKRSIAYGTFGMQEAREQLVQIALQVGAVDSVPMELKKTFAETAAAEMAKQMEASPLDARFPLFLGTLLQAFGDRVNAGLAFQKAHELSPAKQTILFELGANKFARGDTKGALETYKEAFELAPGYHDARVLYAALAIRTGNDALAEELLAPIKESGLAADPRIAAAYVTREQYGKMVPLWEVRVQKRPLEADGYFVLAAAYYGAGQRARAIETLQKVSEVVPSAKAQADAFIVEIRNGTLKLTL